MFCKHNWEKINQAVIESEADTLSKLGYRPNSHVSLKQTLITDYQCKKCGKLKRFKDFSA